MRGRALLLWLVFAGLLGAMAAKSLLIALPPVRAHAEPGRFDANRAFFRLERILGEQEPHPADTAASDGVRERLVAEIRAIGLQPIVRDQTACNELHKQRGVTCARVRNVIVRLGPERGKALLLSAHYDSNPTGPGAGDAGAGVATLLEVGALLKDRPLRRPVLLLFNEGEELGLIGARAFLADPLSRDVDSLLNFEARGVEGPVHMFETNVPNGASIAAFARSVERPVANSLSTDVYRLLPNYTDVNSFAERGWTTLNFAMIGNETRYHSAGDDLAALDRRTLQHMGDQALATATALSTGVPQVRGEAMFTDLFGRFFVQLPRTIGLALLGALLLAFAWLCWRRRAVGRALAANAAAIVLAAALAWAGMALLGTVRPGMFWRAYPHWTHLAVYASALLACVAMLKLIGGDLDRKRLRPAFWLLFLLHGAALALAAPGGAIFFLLPPALVLTGALADRYRPGAERIGAIAALVVLFLTLGALLGLLEDLASRGPLWVFAPLGALLLLPALIEARPLLARASRREAIGGAAVLALAGWAAASIAPAYSADRQQQFTLDYLRDAPSGRSHWSLVNDDAPPPQAYKQLASWRMDAPPYSKRKRWMAPAPAVGGLAAPAIATVASRAEGTGRRVRLRLAPNGAETVALVAPEESPILAAGTNGFLRTIDQSLSKGMTTVRCYGRSCDGMEIDLVLPGRGPVELFLIGSRPGLPGAARPLLDARPTFARPQYSPNSTTIFSKVRL